MSHYYSCHPVEVGQVTANKSNQVQTKSWEGPRVGAGKDHLRFSLAMAGRGTGQGRAYMGLSSVRH